MAMYCPRCGSFNAGQIQACITCLGPLVKGQSVPDSAKCDTHPAQSPLGRCMSCSKAVCFDCGSMVDGRILCTNCAASSAMTFDAAPQDGGKKKRGKKK